MNNVTKIEQMLQGLTEAELRALNGRVVRMIRHRASQASSQKLATINPGDRVEFDGPYGRLCVGTVEKINIKSATIVDCDYYPRGVRVAGSMLRPHSGSKGRRLKIG